MDKKREGAAIDRAARVWMALSIPTHRVGSENAKNAACVIAELMQQVTDGYSFADRTRIAMAKESAQRVEELHKAQMALVAAHVEYMHTRIKGISA